MMLFPFFKFSTLTRVPKGNERCAAVIAPGLQRSPDAVFDVSEYHEARPVSAKASPSKVMLATVNAIATKALLFKKGISLFLQSIYNAREGAGEKGLELALSKKEYGNKRVIFRWRA
jgi:hypothetical protein